MNAFIKHLGQDYDDLAELIKQAHLGHIRLEGNVYVRHGNTLARLFAGILNLPPAGESVHLVVDGYHEEQQMRWDRKFDGRLMQSCFRVKGEYLIENMGPACLWLTLGVEQGVLQYNLNRVSLWGITIPRWCAPRLVAYEKEVGSDYVFGVLIELPIVGKLIEYSGALQLTDLASN